MPPGLTGARRRDQHAQPARQRQRGHRRRPEPDAPRRRHVDGPLQRQQIVAAPGGAGGRRDQQPAAVRDRRRAAARSAIPGHQADIQNLGRNQHRPFRTARQRHRARRDHQHLARRQHQPGRRVRCPWRASRTIVRGSMPGRRDVTRGVLLVGVQAAAVRRPAEQFHQSSVSSRSRTVSWSTLASSAATSRGFAVAFWVWPSRLPRCRARRRRRATPRTEPRRPSFAGPGLVEPHEQHHGPARQRQHGARG